MNRELERKRLVELLDNFNQEKFAINLKISILEKYADYLLDNGIVVPPVKVGDIVYKVYDIETVHRQILELEVLEIGVGNQRKVCLKTTKKHRYNFDKANFDDFGKTVFLTKEEAEKMLKGSKNNG